MHGYETCDRVCPVLDCRWADPLADPAEYIYRSDQYHPVYSGGVQFVLLLDEYFRGKLGEIVKLYLHYHSVYATIPSVVSLVKGLILSVRRCSHGKMCNLRKGCSLWE